MSPHTLPRATPESLGISSKALSTFIAAMDTNIHETHSFMLVRHGQVAAEGWWHPYSPERPHMLFSLSKSFTSTAVGMAVDEGRFSVNDAVTSFFPNDLPRKVSPNLAAMQVRHLLSMVTGHNADTLDRMHRNRRKNWVRNFLGLPVDNPPGAPFVYNNGASYMLSAIVQKVTGQTVLDYLRPRLFDPLGIQHPTWESCPGGINCGGWGLSITTEAIAKLGQLYLQKGVWNGQRLISSEWVAAATLKQVSNESNKDVDWKQGYGYQFWRCQHNAFRADGAFGQFCIVMPEQDAVLAITSGVETMQPTLNLVWQYLLPAFQDKPLPTNKTAHTRLGTQIGAMNLLPPQGKKHSPQAAAVTGRLYQVDPNPVMVSSLQFEFLPEGCRVSILQGKRRRHSFLAGYGAWIEGQTTLSTREPRAIFSSGVWSSEDIFVLTLRYVETPFTQTVTCSFTPDQVVVTPIMNMAFGPKEGPVLTGKSL